LSTVANTLSAGAAAASHLSSRMRALSCSSCCICTSFCASAACLVACSLASSAASAACRNHTELMSKQMVMCTFTAYAAVPASAQQAIRSIHFLLHLPVGVLLSLPLALSIYKNANKDQDRG
jgi:hypothetical protein